MKLINKFIYKIITKLIKYNEIEIRIFNNKITIATQDNIKIEIILMIII